MSEEEIWIKDNFELNLLKSRGILGEVGLVMATTVLLIEEVAMDGERDKYNQMYAVSKDKIDGLIRSHNMIKVEMMGLWATAGQKG